MLITHVHRRRRQQRGSALVVSMLVLTGLATLGGLTVLSVQGGLGASAHEKHKTTALYAAESGAAAAMDFLRANVNTGTGWGVYVEPNNINPQKPTQIFGNSALPGDPANLFGADTLAWYEVEILNNLDDGEFATGGDKDKRVIIRSTGHGPNGAVAQVEWDVGVGKVGGTRPCPSYGQKGMSEDGTGRNDCLDTVIATDVATYTPGGN
jgi:V8-like Glu-specific endopeptidase